MDERKNFPCKNCGGELLFDPSSSKMKCQYCGSLFEIEEDKSFNPEKEEKDLIEFLAKNQEFKGYGVTLYEVECKNCGARISTLEKRRDMVCPFCSTIYVGEANESKNLIEPVGIIPFEISLEHAIKKFKDWITKGFFTPSQLKKIYKLEKIQGIYLPFFTVDAKAKSSWSALSGYYYYVDESVPVIRGGKKNYDKRMVRKIRWEVVSGEREDSFDDILIPAILSERLNLIYKVFPFDIKNGLKPYKSDYLAGFAIFNSELTLKEVYAIAKSQIERTIYELCSRDIVGDTYKDLRVKTELSSQTFKHILLPFWLLTFKYKNKNYPFLINGQTGKMYGEKPMSIAKIILIAASLILSIILLILIFGVKS